MSEANVQVAVEKPEVTAVGKTKGKKAESGNLILDIAQEVENLTKTKALNMADSLANSIETDYIKLGGVLNLISSNSWYEGFDSFGGYVLEKFGFAERKAWYLVGIYKNLVEQQIPWDKVKGLGWSKLKELCNPNLPNAPILTLETVDDWVAKAEALTVKELQELLKPSKGDTTGSTATTSEFSNLTFKVKPDQLETINMAVAKAKGELHTEFDAVALENICSGYLAGIVGGAVPNLETTIKQYGFEAVLEKVAAMFPEWDINVDVAKPAETAEAQ